MNNNGNIQYVCESCNKSFGNRRSNYVKHCNSNKHLEKVNNSKNEIIIKKTLTPQPDAKDKQIEQLTNMIHLLQQQMEEMKQSQNSPRTSSPIVGEESADGNYSISEILNRNDNDLQNPVEKNWKKFVMDAYYFEGEIAQTITSNYPAVSYAANLLVAKLKSTSPINLPILFINKKSGSKRKIAYYNQRYGEFIVKTDIEKKKEHELYQLLLNYLGMSGGQKWLKKKLKSMYNELPIEIRDRMYFENNENNKLSFMNLYCMCEDSDHICYKKQEYYDATSNQHIYRYKDSELMKPDKTKFSLKGSDFTEFIQEYYDHIENHEYCDDYKLFRTTQNEMTCIWATHNDDLKTATDELFECVSNLCGINPLLQLRK